MTGVEATAFHEAGHAVITLRVPWPYGWTKPISYVTIKPDDEQGSLGHVRHSPPPSWFWEDMLAGSRPRATRFLENLVIGAWAGAIAEEKFTGQWNQTGCDSDLDAVIDLCIREAGSEAGTNDLIARLKDRCVEILNEPETWEWVEAVAAALLERQTLSRSDVLDLRPTPPAPLQQVTVN